MSIWKQTAVTLVLIALAAVLWAYFYPGAGQVLARLKLDWLPVASTAQSTSDEPVAAPTGNGGFGGSDPAVYAAPVATATINDRLSAIGTGRAFQTVSVKPYDSGRLTKVIVASGGRVDAGDVIARLDSENEEIAVDKAQIVLEDAERTLQRLSSLRASNAVTEVQVTQALLARNNARLELRQAELDLSRRSVLAPISGIVGILPITAGNYVTSDTEIATIDDRSSILVDFWVPERFAGAISVGDEVTATSVARPGEAYDGIVSALDNRVDETSRTLHVEARLPNDDDRLRAGMSFQVRMRFPGDSYPSVDPLAVQWGTDGAFVWAVRDGRAERVAVRIVQRNAETVLLDAPLVAGDVVVTEGIHIVREGEPVKVAERSPVSLSPGELGAAATSSGS